jgi:ribosome modulation factor
MNVEAYEAGYAAYFNETSCPSEDPEYFDSWVEGYYAAEEDTWEDEGLNDDE